MAEGGMAMRLVNLAKVFVGFIRGGMAIVNILASTLFGLHLGLLGRRYRVDRLGDDPADDQAGLPARLRHQRDHLRLGAGPDDPASHNAVIYSVAAGGTISVASLFLAGHPAGLLFGACLIGLVVWTAHKRSFPVSEPPRLKRCRGSSARRCGGW